MLGEGDQKRQATVGNVINVKGMRTISISGGLFANYRREFVVEICLFFLSFLSLVDESPKKMSGFASCVHRDLFVLVCSHESARVTYTTYIIDDFELKRSSIEVKKLP